MLKSLYEFALQMDRDSESFAELRARLDVAMGGRAAEELMFGKEK